MPILNNIYTLNENSRMIQVALQFCHLVKRKEVFKWSVLLYHLIECCHLLGDLRKKN